MNGETNGRIFSRAKWVIFTALAFQCGMPVVGLADTKEKCYDWYGRPRAEWQADCDRAIASGRYNGRELADMLVHRADIFQNFDDALRRFDQAIAIDPNYHGPYRARALAWLRAKNDPRKAIESFEEAWAKAAPSDRRTLGLDYWAMAWHALGVPDKALQMYEAAIKNDPEFDLLVLNRANILRELGRLDEALADYNVVISRRANGLNAALSGRGLVYEIKGDRQRATADYEMALRNPRRTDIWSSEVAKQRIERPSIPLTSIPPAPIYSTDVDLPYVKRTAALRPQSAEMPGQSSTPVQSRPSTPVQTSSTPDRDDIARRDYELASRVGTRGAWDAFLRKYQSGFYADLARIERDKSR